MGRNGACASDKHLHIRNKLSGLSLLFLKKKKQQNKGDFHIPDLCSTSVPCCSKLANPSQLGGGAFVFVILLCSIYFLSVVLLFFFCFVFFPPLPFLGLIVICINIYIIKTVAGQSSIRRLIIIRYCISFPAHIPLITPDEKQAKKMRQRSGRILTEAIQGTSKEHHQPHRLTAPLTSALC